MRFIRALSLTEAAVDLHALIVFGVGFVNDWRRGAGNVNFRYVRDRHDQGMFTIAQDAVSDLHGYAHTILAEVLGANDVKVALAAGEQPAEGVDASRVR